MNGTDTGATITFLNKKTVTESFTYTSVSPASCPSNSYGNPTAGTILEESENATITGSTAKFTAGPVPGGNVCIYLNGDGSILVASQGPTHL